MMQKSPVLLMAPEWAAPIVLRTDNRNQAPIWLWSHDRTRLIAIAYPVFRGMRSGLRLLLIY
jgi:hypothetical protein